MNVNELPGKWRGEADALASSMAGIPAGPTRIALEAEIVRLRKDANELESALASRPAARS